MSSYGSPEVRGRDQIIAGERLAVSLSTDATSSASRVWEHGNVVIVDLSWAGTMTGDLGGLKASHRPIGQRRVHVFWFDSEGLVDAAHEYADDFGTVGQMKGLAGVPPPPPIQGSAPQWHVAKRSRDEDSLARWVRSIDTEWSRDDPRAALALMATDAEYTVNFNGEFKSTEGLIAHFGAMYTAFPDQKWTATQAWGIDGFAILEHTMTAMHRGPFGSLPASNKPVTGWHWLSIFQPNPNGKIWRAWSYANPMEMLQQTGAIR
jgi:steroid delta-isomerase-like uncharacterized protein